MLRRLTVCLSLHAIFLTACSFAFPEPTPNIPATVTAQVEQGTVAIPAPTRVPTQAPAGTVIQIPTPTGIPYSSSTDEALEALATALENVAADRPTYTPEPTKDVTSPRVPAAAPTSSPEHFYKVGDKEWFEGQTLAHIERAEALFEQGKYQEALQQYEKARESNNGPSKVIENWIGNTHSAMGNYQKAMDQFTKAILIDDDQLNRTNRALAYARLGKCTEAVQDIKKGFALAEKDEASERLQVEAHMIAATCYIELEQYDKARHHQQEGLRLAPLAGTAKEQEALRLLGEELKELEEGRIYPEDFLNEEEHLEYQEISNLLAQGKLEQVANRLESLQAQRERASSKLEIDIANIYEELGQPQKALIHLNTAVDLRDDSYTRIARAWSRMFQGDCETATADARIALDTRAYIETGFHSGAEAHSILAACYSGDGDLQAAEIHLAMAINLGESHGYTQEDIEFIRVLGSQGYKEAFDTFEDAAMDDPFEGMTCDEILQIQFQFQQGADSSSRMKQVIEQVQAQRSECSASRWNPTVIEHLGTTVPQVVDNSTAHQSERDLSQCFAGTENEEWAVGGYPIPETLRSDEEEGRPPTRGSTRDPQGNVLVYWSRLADQRPYDQSACWLYVAHEDQWFSNR